MSKCPLCGDYRGFPEIEYPDVDPVRVFGKRELQTLVEVRNPKLDWDGYTKLRDRLQVVLPPGSFLAPAAGFGVVLAKVFKPFEGFNCAGLGRIISSREVLEALRTHGIDLQSTEVSLRQGVAREGEIRYVYIPLFGRPFESAGISTCVECCRPSRPVVRGADEVISADSLPVEAALFRLAYSPTKLVFRDDLVRVLVDDLGVKSLKFSPLQVA